MEIDSFLASSRLFWKSHCWLCKFHTPNPNWDRDLYRKLYEETDVSKLEPAKKAADMTPKLAAWRKLMDEVVRKK